MDPLSPRERQRLDDDGYLALEGLVQPGRVRAMLTRLEELLAVTEQSHAGTLIVGGLLDEPVFDAAWYHPRVLAAMRQVLGDDHRMLGLASRGLRPGHGQQALHVDWGGQRLVIRGTMEPLAEGSEAFMTVEPRRVVLLEE